MHASQSIGASSGAGDAGSSLTAGSSFDGASKIPASGSATSWSAWKRIGRNSSPESCTRHEAEIGRVGDLHSADATGAQTAARIIARRAARAALWNDRNRIARNLGWMLKHLGVHWHTGVCRASLPWPRCVEMVGLGGTRCSEADSMPCHLSSATPMSSTSDASIIDGGVLAMRFSSRVATDYPGRAVYETRMGSTGFAP
jgi:hypothetical protein